MERRWAQRFRGADLLPLCPRPTGSSEWCRGEAGVVLTGLTAQGVGLVGVSGAVLSLVLGLRVGTRSLALNIGVGWLMGVLVAGLVIGSTQTFSQIDGRVCILPWRSLNPSLSAVVLAVICGVLGRSHAVSRPRLPFPPRLGGWHDPPPPTSALPVPLYPEQRGSSSTSSAPTRSSSKSS